MSGMRRIIEAVGIRALALTQLGGIGDGALAPAG